MTTTTTQPTIWKAKDCHKGNSLVYQHPKFRDEEELEHGMLMIGGWNQGATFDWNTYVIDLTGMEHKYQDIPFAYDNRSQEFLPFCGNSYAGWLSLPFPDYQVPSRMKTREQWEGMTEKIHALLAEGHNVLVACHGGHGRSGLFCSIVGYMLNIREDDTWSSPVEKLRSIHCNDAVETISQEKFVYDVLGLRIQITRSYITDYDGYNWYGRGGATYKYTDCPICGTQSMFVEEIGMCKGCQIKFETQKIPVREDLTLKDIENKGLVAHTCDRPKCCGIWKASKCGHITHDMLVYEGYCQACWDKYSSDTTYAEDMLARLHEDDDPTEEPAPLGAYMAECPLCSTPSSHAFTYGLCYDCAEKIKVTNMADAIHNSLTDPYKAVDHACDNIGCLGIVQADVCLHVVHNMDVEDGMCPDCLIKRNKRGNGRDHKED